MDETTPTTTTTKPAPLDYKMSQQSSVCSNNLLKPDSGPWGPNNNDTDLMRVKSQSISNIAGK